MGTKGEIGGRGGDGDVMAGEGCTVVGAMSMGDGVDLSGGGDGGGNGGGDGGVCDRGSNGVEHGGRVDMESGDGDADYAREDNGR